jgi:2-oxo-3-hexenedioate decarboxylase
LRPENASDILRAYDTGTMLPAPPSAINPAFDLDAAYAVEAELVRLRRAQGRRTVGRKVGFANKAAWRILKLETLVWAHMYDNTVHHAPDNDASLSTAGRVAPRIEPEIVFKLARPLGPGADAPTALAAVEWMALGFEINDCVFPDWKFTPADFVAAFGFHVALVVGAPAPAAPLASLSDALAAFTLTLSKNGVPVETGSGKNALRSPALCLAELAAAISRRPGAEPLAAGELVSTGTLTTPQPVADGDVWRAEVSGLDLPPLTITFTQG